MSLLWFFPKTYIIFFLALAGLAGPGFGTTTTAAAPAGFGGFGTTTTGKTGTLTFHYISV